MNQGPVVYLPKKGPNSVAGKSKKKRGVFNYIFDAIILILVAVVTVVIFKLTSVKTENQEVNNPDVISDVEKIDKEEDNGNQYNLQSVLRSWRTFGMNDFRQAVYIIDLDRNEVIGELDAQSKYSMESLYKLFVAYEGYKAVEVGSLDGKAESFEGKTVEECLDLMVRESNSGCAENILDKIGESNMDSIIASNWGLQNSSISDLSTTAEDMARAMQYIYKHKDISPENWKKLKDSMLNQTAKIADDFCKDGCSLRQGLPSGFTRGTKVYDKVGWKNNGSYWVYYNDAAILEFPEQNRHFAMVVLTEKHPDTKKISNLGSLVEEALLSMFEYE
ncbi:serine hydrolase [Candidatus Saccharibacteria bacterium]|nr:serine hydrolase [Candidatus Saccharibacteria bacterium]